MTWVEKLKTRWKVDSAYKVVLILIVFACTGTTVVLIKGPIFEFLYGVDEIPVWVSILYYILILPVYNLFLLLYGLLFGQFQFFWSFEKRFISRLMGIFKG
ncbi:MAG: prolipoprotein diacylglyceryl transferase [Cyclobacteriaceae bacterium]